MLLEKHDAIVCLLVDRRYQREKSRLEGLFGHHQNFRFFVDGDGKILAPQFYDQTTRFNIPAGMPGGQGVWQHFLAMREIVQRAKEANWQSFLFVEDDVVLTPDFAEVVQAADEQMASLPAWDLLYYGANHSGAITRDLSTNVMRVNGSLTTHAVAFRNSIYDAFLGIRPTTHDDLLMSQVLQPTFNCYAIWPQVALQKPGFSTIWNQSTDYSECFKSKGKNR